MKIGDLKIDSCYKFESDKLSGAVNPKTYESIWGTRGSSYEGANELIFFRNKVDKSRFKIDFKNNVYYNDNGAVFDAYDLSPYANDYNLQKKIAKMIMMKCKVEYPEYDFVMTYDVFPLYYKHDSFTSTDDLFIDSNFALSTHVLYVKNYKKHIVNDENPINFEYHVNVKEIEAIVNSDKKNSQTRKSK